MFIKKKNAIKNILYFIHNDIKGIGHLSEHFFLDLTVPGIRVNIDILHGAQRVKIVLTLVSTEKIIFFFFF